MTFGISRCINHEKRCAIIEPGGTRHIIFENPVKCCWRSYVCVSRGDWGDIIKTGDVNLEKIVSLA